MKTINEVLGGNKKFLKYKGCKIPIHSINIFPQPRRTFEYISELALDIAKKGLLNPITVACFDEKNCRKYIRTINLLWRTNFKIRELKAVETRGKKVYFVLLAGERRLKSCHFLWEEGCEECREKYGKEPAGECFKRHFKSNKVEIRSCLNISPFLALSLQFSENTHMAVPPHEEAHAYSLLFKLVKKANPDFSLAAFAREVGRNQETIKRALWYCELPVNIQEAVERKTVPYGIAVEIARLQKNNVKEEDLWWWLTRAVAENFNISEFKNKVNAYLEEQLSNQNQLSLMDIFSEEQQKIERRLHIKNVVQKNIINGFWFWTYYFKRVIEYFDNGWLGKEDSPFSFKSPLGAFREVIGILERLLPHLKSLISEKEYQKAQAIIAESWKAVIELEKVAV